MKAVVLIILSSFYLVVSTGFSLNLHYCGGKLKKVSLADFNEKDCCGGEMKSDGCCHNKSLVFKMTDKQDAHKQLKINFNKVIYSPQKLSPEIPYLVLVGEQITIPENYHAPPIHSKTPLFLRNRILRI